MIPNRSLTKNFSLHEMLVSQTAVRMGYTEQFDPSEAVIANLEALCKNILQPLRDALGHPLRISSGFRCQRVNIDIGGATKSQHLTGHAADIEDFEAGNEQLLRTIVALQLPFDQVINEFGFQWIHVSFDPSKHRRQVLEAVKQNGRTVYNEIVLQ